MATVAPITKGPFAKADETPIHGRDPHHDNQPPLEERLLMDFVEELDREGITARVTQLIANARTCTSCPDEQTAGKIGDLARMASEVGKRVDAAREKLNRPLLTSQKALKAKADALIQPLMNEVLRLRGELTKFARAEAERKEAERRAAEEERRRAEEALRQANISKEVIAEVIAEPVKEEPAPVARGDLGARVGTRTIWMHEIENVRKLPDRLLKHPKVVEALDKLIAAEVKGASGQVKITGVRIWSEQGVTVR